MVRLARLGKSMLMPESFSTGVAEAIRARATATREALQNMVKRASSSLRSGMTSGAGEQE